MTTTEGNLHAAQTTLRLRGETRAQHLSVSEPPLSAASHFPPKSPPVPDTKGTTRHQTPGVRAAQAAPQCLPTPFSAASGKIVTRRKGGNARPGSVRSFHPRTKSLFLRPRRAHKRSTQRGSANTVITCQTRFRRPPGGVEDCTNKKHSLGIKEIQYVK